MNDRQILLNAKLGKLTVQYDKTGKVHRCSQNIDKPLVTLWRLVNTGLLKCEYRHPVSHYSLTLLGHEFLNDNEGDNQ